MARIITIAAAAVLLLVVAASSADANIVYIGLDPSSSAHPQPQTGPLIANATRFAAGMVDPRIALFREAPGGGFGFTTDTKMAAQGLTMVNTFNANQVGAVLGGAFGMFDVLYFAPTTVDADIANYVANAAGIAAFASGGGGLVVEPNVFAAASWTWVPDAALIGHSGATNVGTENVSITAAGMASPVMTGLTGPGLSGWGFSIHSNFRTPEAAGFETLALDVTSGNIPTIIARVSGPPPGPGVIPEPASFSLLGVAGLGLAAYVWRRRKA